jgi:hypothetical protein
MDTVKTVEIEQVMRLAAKAKQEGVRLYVDRRDGRHYASSATTAGRLYFVTLASCTCPGFVSHGRCKHWAALQLAIALDGSPDPDPVAVSEIKNLISETGAVLPACDLCFDAGLIDAPRSRWVGGCQTGYRDEWTSPTPCPGCQPVAA